MPDKRKIHSESYVKVLQDIINNLVLKTFTAYSLYSNEIVFNKLLEGYIYNDIIKNSVLINRADFEEIIHNHFSLQQAYLEIYNSDSEFYSGCIDDHSLTLTYHLVINNEQLIFVFLSSFIQNPLC